MTFLNKKYSVLSLLILGLCMFGFINQVHANPSFFIRNNATATATTTPSFMTTGTATTTNAIDSQVGSSQSLDSAVLKFQLTASSTATVANIAYEYADNTFDSNGVPVDCVATPTACDWYQDNVSIAATSTPANISLGYTKTWAFASSTIGGVLVTTQRLQKLISVPTPMRYTRAVISLTGANGGVWAQMVAKRESTN